VPSAGATASPESPGGTRWGSRKNAAQQAVATAPSAPAAGDDRPSSTAVAAPAATNGRPAECIGGSVSRARPTRCRSVEEIWVAANRGDAMRFAKILDWVGVGQVGNSRLSPYARSRLKRRPGEGHRKPAVPRREVSGARQPFVRSPASRTVISQGAPAPPDDAGTPRLVDSVGCRSSPSCHSPSVCLASRAITRAVRVSWISHIS